MAVDGVGSGGGKTGQTNTAASGASKTSAGSAVAAQKKEQSEVKLAQAQVNNVPSDKKVPDFQAGVTKYNLNQALPAQGPPNQVGGLSKATPANVSLGPNDTQADALKKAYEDFGKKAGLSDPKAFAEKLAKPDAKLIDLKTNQVLTDAQFEASKKAGTISVTPSDATINAAREQKLKDLTSTSFFSPSVSEAKQKEAVELLKNDPNLNATIKNLDTDGKLGDLLKGIDNPAQRRELVSLLGKKTDDAAAAKVLSELEKIDIKNSVIGAPGGSIPGTDVNANLWQAKFNLARMGIDGTSAPFDRSPYAGLPGAAPTSPFSGVGATGVNPTANGVPIGDQAGLYWEKVFGEGATTAKYSNPLPGDLKAYLDSLPPGDRAKQAELLLKQPVSTTMPDIYGPNLPSRADVIKAAAAKYNLDPKMVAALVLAEQRDQSANEDAKDYTGAANGVNTSVGLGQVVLSTARNNDLFSDLMSSKTLKTMKDYELGRTLADDTANIFAVAKYARIVADKAASAPPEVQARFPGVDFSKYALNSSSWPAANIAALGSEYTSAPWDLRPSGNYTDSPGWGYFVGEAYKDVAASGVFK